jgi:hypothetical protein
MMSSSASKDPMNGDSRGLVPMNHLEKLGKRLRADEERLGRPHTRPPLGPLEGITLEAGGHCWMKPPRTLRVLEGPRASDWLYEAARTSTQGET